MPGTIRLRILEARNLPVMDRGADTTDAFVEIHIGNTLVKTDVCQKSLNPRWNTEWFVFEVDDLELQSESLQLRVMDYDTYSANDQVGRVYIDLNFLTEAAYRSHTTPSYKYTHDDTATSITHPSDWTMTSQIDGWLPIIDTLHGPRGELKIALRFELIADRNQLKETAANLPIFVSSHPPSGYRLVNVQGLVYELVSSGDPEHYWMDKLRTPRATNEARQALLRRLSATVARKIAFKARQVGSNAVLGYRLCFDVEGVATGQITVRAIGTAVSLFDADELLHRRSKSLALGGGEAVQRQMRLVMMMMSSPRSDGSLDNIERRRQRRERTTSATSEASDGSRGDSRSPSATTENRHFRWDFIGQDPRTARRQQSAFTRPAAMTIAADPIHGVTSVDHHPDPTAAVPPFDTVAAVAATLPLLTLDGLPDGVVDGVGGLVSARSVRLLSDLDGGEKEEKTEVFDGRERWWSEMRNEIRLHMQSLRCNAVVGYRETSSVRGEVVLLSCSGTAVLLDSSVWLFVDPIAAARHDHSDLVSSPSNQKQLDCSFCHVAYSDSSAPFPIALRACTVCGEASVPDLVLATTPVPGRRLQHGSARPVQSSVWRKLTNTEEDEDEAAEISDLLPFIEHQLYSNLVTELRSQNGTGIEDRNALFGLRTEFAIGPDSLVAVATGLAVCLVPLLDLSASTVALSGAKEASKPIRKGKSEANVLELARDRNAIVLPLIRSSATRQSSIPPNATVDKLLRDDHSDDNSSAASDTAVAAVATTQHSRRLSWGSIKDSFRLSASRTELLTGAKVQQPPTPSNGNGEPTGVSTERRIELRVWQQRQSPSSAVGDADDRSISHESGEKTMVKRQLDKLVKKLKRRQIEREDFETAVFQRALTLQIGLLDERCVFANQTTNTTASNNVAGVALFERRRRKSSALSTESGATDEVSLTVGQFSNSGRCRIVGHYDATFIRETSALKELGGVDVFVERCLVDALTAVRAHVRAAVGVDGVQALRLTLVDIGASRTKNQALCLLGFAGDLVKMERKHSLVT